MILQLVSSKYFFLQIYKNIQFKNTVYTQFKGYFLSLSSLIVIISKVHTFFKGKKLRSPQKNWKPSLDAVMKQLYPLPSCNKMG